MGYPNLDRVFMRYLGTGLEVYQLQLCDDYGTENYQVNDTKKVEQAEGIEVFRLLLQETGLPPMLMEYNDDHGPCVIIDGVFFDGEQTAPILAAYNAQQEEPEPQA